MHLRAIPVALAAAALTVTGPAALADLVSNDLDDSVDATHELMALEYDTGPDRTATTDDIAGPARSTTLRILVDGEVLAQNEEHPGCNLPGGQLLRVSASFDATVAAVTFPQGSTFSDCTSTVQVRVAPEGVGETRVTFTGVLVKANGTATNAPDARKDFDLTQAAFRVVVVEADLSDGGGTGTACDRNPAAPAWANAILRANDVKLLGDDRRDVIRSVAREMGKAAAFPDGAGGQLIAKSAESYPYEVHEYLVAEFTDLDLPLGPDDVDRPGKVCTTVTAH